MTLFPKRYLIKGSYHTKLCYICHYRTTLTWCYLLPSPIPSFCSIFPKLHWAHLETLITFIVPNLSTLIWYQYLEKITKFNQISKREVLHYTIFFMHISGDKLGKVAALFPVMYLSGGTCVMLIITGGGTLKLLFKTLCENDHGVKTCNAHSLSGVEWFLVFTCVAIFIAQLPNLSSVAPVSLIGAVAAIGYCTLFWALSVKQGRPNGVSYSTTLHKDSSTVAKTSDIMNAIGIILLAFRGHNVLLEIQASHNYDIRYSLQFYYSRTIIFTYF